MGSNGGDHRQRPEKSNEGEGIKQILFSLLLILFIASLPRAEDIKPVNPWVRGSESLLLPGLGQILNGKPVKAVAFIAAAAGGLILVMDNSKQLELSFDEYVLAFASDPLTAGESYDRYENKYYFNQYLITGVVFFWIFNALDAFFDAHFLAIDLRMKKKQLNIYMETKF